MAGTDSRRGSFSVATKSAKCAQYMPCAIRSARDAVGRTPLALRREVGAPQRRRDVVDERRPLAPRARIGGQEPERAGRERAHRPRPQPRRGDLEDGAHRPQIGSEGPLAVHVLDARGRAREGARHRPALGRQAQAVEAAERGGHADAASEVATPLERDHAIGDGRGRPAGAPARGARRIERVLGDATDPARAFAHETQVAQVGLAEQHRARVLERAMHGGALGRHLVAVAIRAPRRREARDLPHVLERVRHVVQHAPGALPAKLLVLGKRLVEAGRHERAQLAVARAHPRDGLGHGRSRGRKTQPTTVPRTPRASRDVGRRRSPRRERPAAGRAPPRGAPPAALAPP